VKQADNSLVNLSESSNASAEADEIIAAIDESDLDMTTMSFVSGKDNTITSYGVKTRVLGKLAPATVSIPSATALRPISGLVGSFPPKQMIIPLEENTTTVLRSISR
jgi:hypothetical protein